MTARPDAPRAPGTSHRASDQLADGPVTGNAAGVRPLDWLYALRFAPVFDDKATAPTVLALVRFAPARPRPRACRAHRKPSDGCAECEALAWAFWASHEQLAEVVRSSARTMERGTRTLRAGGYLDLVRQGSGGHASRANEYRLAVPTPADDLTDGPEA